MILISADDILSSSFASGAHLSAAKISVVSGSSNNSAINSIRFREICGYNSVAVSTIKFDLAEEASVADPPRNEPTGRIGQWAEAADTQIRICWICKRGSVFQGIASDDKDGDWVAFFCKRCVPHLSVRRSTQAPTPLLPLSRALCCHPERARMLRALLIYPMPNPPWPGDLKQ